MKKIFIVIILLLVHKDPDRHLKLQ